LEKEKRKISTNFSNELLTVREGAQILGVSPRALLRLIQQGRIPARRMGWIWMISKKGLLEYGPKEARRLRTRQV